MEVTPLHGSRTNNLLNCWERLTTHTGLTGDSDQEGHAIGYSTVPIKET